MAKALLKFRCYRCDKLLGTSYARAGKTTVCPSCKADLVVPEVEAPPDEELRAGTLALVPNLEEPASVNETVAKPGHDPGFSWEEIDERIFETAAEAHAFEFGITTSPPEEPSPELEPPPARPESPPLPVPSEPAAAILDPPPPDVVPEITLEAPAVRTERTTRRRPGEVVLTQGVIASWSLFMLLALAISFVAGLFAGHFLWKG
jgi:phage FluMu protein Com